MLFQPPSGHTYDINLKLAYSQVIAFTRFSENLTRGQGRRYTYGVNFKALHCLILELSHSQTLVSTPGDGIPHQLLRLSGKKKKKQTSKTKQKISRDYHLDGELQLTVHFRHQKIMGQSLPHLHDPHNGSINLVLTILKDPFCGAGLLLHLSKRSKLKIIFRSLKNNLG